MEVEDLTKSQLILLTLLVSFVTSIATGIVTVTLMEQAPEGVTNTITHVVERTVEQVVPEVKNQTAQVIEVPVVTTEEDLVLKAIKKVAPAVGVVKQKVDGEVKVLGSAFLIDNIAGLFVTAPVLVEPKTEYIITLNNGLSVTTKSEDVIGVKARLQTVTAEDRAKLKNIEPLEKATTSLNVGQSILGVAALGLNANHEVTTGIISAISKGSTTTPSRFIYSVVPSEHVGAPVVDIHGLVVGIVVEARKALVF
ncbi:MAG: S1C family serine protease [Candidatus Paceibacterota bacterium]